MNQEPTLHVSITRAAYDGTTVTETINEASYETLGRVIVMAQAARAALDEGHAQPPCPQGSPGSVE